MRTCDCGQRIPEPKRQGRTPLFCSGACRQRAYRNRAKTGIPKRMTSVRRWVRCVGKRPVTITGASASSTNANTWASFKAVQGGTGDGYGVMLGDGLACWDLDHCITDGKIELWAERILSGIENPLWVEVSVSGTGLHIFVESPEAPGSRSGGVEFYSRGRFIRVTGVKYDARGGSY